MFELLLMNQDLFCKNDGALYWMFLLLLLKGLKQCLKVLYRIGPEAASLRIVVACDFDKTRLLDLMF